MSSFHQIEAVMPKRVTSTSRSDEQGFMLLAVVVMVALLLIALSVAAPVVARQLRREKEVESQHRMEQYVRAIQLYQRKFPGQYPASIKVLEDSNNLRFLRHPYVDPLTGKSDYKLIHQGEQKTKIHVFFGQELSGMAASLGSASGIASSGGMGSPMGGGVGSPVGGGTNVNPTNALNSGFGGAAIGGAPGAGGAGGIGGIGGGGGIGTTGTNGTTSAAGTSGTTGSSGADVFGDGTGGVIVGVGTSKSGDSITEPNAQTTYQTWEFWYDPRIEALKQSVSITGGGVSSQSASSFGQNGATGQPNSGGVGAFGAPSAFGAPGAPATGAGGSTGASGSAPPTGSTGTGTTGVTPNPNPNSPAVNPNPF